MFELTVIKAKLTSIITYLLLFMYLFNNSFILLHRKLNAHSFLYFISDSYFLFVIILLFLLSFYYYYYYDDDDDDDDDYYYYYYAD